MAADPRTIMSDHNPHDLDGRVAVIGMAARLPRARSIVEFRDNLRNGVESIRMLSEQELIDAGESLEAIRDPAYVPAAAPLEDIDMFDAGFFGMSPRDAAVFDPQHRVLLELAWEAFEHAGYVGSRINGSVAVFASCGLSEYMFKNAMSNQQIASSVGEWLVRHTGNDTNFLATRISYELDLDGPSMNVQTACSSSLVAVHLACQSLLNGECDVALAGGAVVAPVQHKGYFYKEGEILSPDGHCRPFDARSAGTVISSAAGCVLLKPLAAALADGDNVLAVIRGSAINNDGRDKVGYLAPSVSGQARVVSEALAVAGVGARQVGYIECHGTGTLLGDPIEIAGLTTAFREYTDDTQFCAIGSLKSNIGHAGEAAGVAGLIKTVLSLQYGELYPSLHYHEPNPQADLPSSPFWVNATLRDWPADPHHPRLAGVTGLGAGGTNVHVVLEQAPAVAPRPAAPAIAVPQLITVSARTEAGLQRACSELAAHLRDHPSIDLADVAFTRLQGRAGFKARRAVVARTVQQAAEALEATDSRSLITGVCAGGEPSVAFMMPGGGAQYASMGAGLYRSEPVFRQAIDDCCAITDGLLGVQLRDLLYPAADIDQASKRLERPGVALPALFATGYAMARLLQSKGIDPSAMIGHSAGEYVVACLSGVMSLDDALALVIVRGRLFESLPQGGMISVQLDEREVLQLLPAELSIAAVNAPGLCVVSGPVAELDAFDAVLRDRDVETMRVHIDVAAHSTMLEPILDEFAAFCRSITLRPPQIPYVSNLTGTWATAADVTDPGYWVRHLRHTVRFGDGMAALLADGNRVLVEIGPGRALSTFARMGSPAPAGVTPTLRHPQELADDDEVLLAAIGRIWASGVELDAAQWFDVAARRRVPLPTYPWDRQRYWVDPDPVGTRHAPATMRKRHDLSEWFAVPSWRPEPALTEPSAARPAGVTLVVHTGHPLATSLIERLGAHGERVASVSFGSGFDRSSRSRYEVDPRNPDDWTSVVESLKVSGLPNRIIHMSAVGDPPRRLRRRAAADLAVHTETVDQASLLLMLQPLMLLAQPIELFVVTSGGCAVGAESAAQPERAMLHGVARVVPREATTITTQVVDVDHLSGAAGTVQADALLKELTAPAANGVVALRGGRRWVSELRPLSLPPAAASPWRHGGCYLITGGLGGIGLSIAEHIAGVASAPTIVLASRSGLPSDSTWDALVADPHTDAVTRSRIAAVKRLRATGATVLIERADVSRRADVDSLVERITSVAGSVHGVVHAAGVLDDVLIALRRPDHRSEVVDAKVLGALHLVDALSGTGTEFIVLCSSVSSFLGLPGQADYTAANAALDAVAHRAGTDMRVVSINWNTWQEVGMAAEVVRHERAAPAGGMQRGPLVPPQSVHDSGHVVSASLPMSRASHWLLDEHVMVHGDALIPGTGFLEIIREMVMLAAGDGATSQLVRLEDVVFASPFAVGSSEVRNLEIGLDRRDQTVTLYSDTPEAPHVVATYELVGRPASGSVPAVDVDALRARCVRRVDRFDGYSDQPFMNFGRRWGSLFSVGFGDDEAIITTRLPDLFVSELDDLWLHPALLDMATGSAQALIPGFDQASSFYVPFGYQRVLVYGPLPPDAVSHVRLTSGEATATAVFDIDICDPSGRVAVSIAGFTMRLVDAAAPMPRRHQLDDVPSESALARALRQGILPSEGVDALDRILAARLGPQVVASSVDVGAWVAEVDREALGPAGSAGGAGPQFERPDLGVAFVEPATPVERRIAAIWSELLGVAAVGRDDDFFELGGQSLIAIRLMTRLQREFGVRLQLSDIFELQTLRSLAAAIEERNPVLAAESVAAAAGPSGATPGRAADATWKSLVQVSAGGEGLPLFVVHGAGGNVLFLWSLAKQLHGIRPVYGFQARGIDAADEPDPSLHHMAQRYVDELVAFHPGPYLLGGYSGGGLIAMEMTELLRAKDLEVLHVLLLDSSPNGAAPTSNGQRLGNLLRNIPKAGVRRMWPFFRHKLARNYHKLVKPSARSAERREAMARELGHREFEGYVNLTAYFTDLVAHYENGQYDVPATLLKADTEWPVMSFDYDWHKYNKRPVDIRYVAGDHLNMFSPEISERLGRAVREVLAPF
jgi:acyl transferase domain-containing protein/thioesterase domain-containing protein/acyl carrier protein